jgi:hypothetical protein
MEIARASRAANDAIVVGIVRQRLILIRVRNLCSSSARGAPNGSRGGCAPQKQSWNAS